MSSYINLYYYPSITIRYFYFFCLFVFPPIPSPVTSSSLFLLPNFHLLQVIIFCTLSIGFLWANIFISKGFALPGFAA